MTGNEQLVQSLIDEGFLKSPRLIQAFRSVDRADFVLPEYRAEAYGNHPLPIGEEQTISQPLTVAFMLELLDPQPGEKILDIGSGSGWTSALLSAVVGETGKVFAIERIRGLCALGEKNLKKYSFSKTESYKHFAKTEPLACPSARPLTKFLQARPRREKYPKHGASR